MEPYRYHVYVCDQRKAEGAPSCSARGSAKLLDALRRELAAQGLMNEVQITTTGSIGMCERGPNMIVYPEGIWYAGVTPADVKEIVASHFKSGKVVERLAQRDADALRTEIAGNRERAMAAMKAQDAAGMMPDELNRAIRGFMESRVILSALELDLFSAVSAGATAEQVAEKLGAGQRATEMLMNALVSLELLEKREGVFYNTRNSSRYFVESTPDNARLATLHIADIWHSWSDLTESVRRGTTRRDEHHEPSFGDQAFVAAMQRNARERAPVVIKAVGAEQVTNMLDLGGGSGGYAIAFAQANPKLHATILDLPQVLENAKRNIAAAGLSGRVSTHAGDMAQADFGKDYDLVLLSAICHMYSPQQNEDLFRRVHQAVAPGGRIVVQDFILEPDKTAPRMGALFALNMLVATRGGGTYNEQEYAAWLGNAGFSQVHRIRLPGPTGLMVGNRE